jgi:hypothetical protein
VLCSNHATTIAELETPVFVQIIISLQEGLKSLGILQTPILVLIIIFDRISMGVSVLKHALR